MTRRRGTNVTIHDVAQRAGVSISTVSRVLNNKDDVAEETFRHVQQVIDELGYSSSLAAYSMRSRKTNMVGLIVPDMEHSFMVQTIRGVSRRVKQFGYDLIVYTSGRDHADLSAMATWEQRQVALLNGSIADGTIVVTPFAQSFRTTHPLVAIDPHNNAADFPTVISTNRTGVMEAIDYLVKLGHKRIGFIGGRADLQSAGRRRQGYLDGLARAGIEPVPHLMLDGDFTVDAGYRCARILLKLPDRPSAIMAANDDTAVGALQAAADAGIAVPEELSIIGFDNVPAAAVAKPALTTVDQSIELMGYTATKLLMDMLQGREITEQLVKIPTKLVIRDSCAAVKPSTR